jgi:hypothetical protein
MKHVLSLAVLLIFSVSVSARGQIDGKENPGKIPDSLAYFMYFSDVGHALDDEAKEPIVVRLLLEGTGLDEVDRSVLKGVIVEHQIEQRILMNKINAEIASGTATQDAIAAYRKARTKCTIDAVSSVLTQVSPEGSVAFKKFVRAFKANLSVDEGAIKGW